MRSNGGGSRNCVSSLGSGAATTLLGKGGLSWQPVQVNHGLVDRAQDLESHGPGFESQLCPPAWTGLLISLCGMRTWDCCEDGKISPVSDVVTGASLVDPLFSKLAPVASSRTAE